MHTRGSIAGLLLGFSMTVGSGAPPPEPDTDDELPRVVLMVNRHVEVRGFVEYEDNDVIVVRSVHNEVESFPKARLLQVVRLVKPRPGQQGVVVLRNGQVRRGVILEDTFEHVLIEIEGIRAKLVREAVDHVELEPTFDERYAALKASLKPQMERQHLALCRWLLEEHRYDLAQVELRELLAATEVPEARRLLRIVDAQLALQQRAAERVGSGGGPPDRKDRVEPDRTAGPVYEQDLLPDTILTPDDVNLIRVLEIDFNDPPKVVVSPDTIRALIEGYATSPLIPAGQAGRTALFQADSIQIVRLMFELRARELYPQIQVISEPRALNMFRQRVHDTWLMNNCATTRCHGGIHAGPLFLHRRHSKDDRVRYTNLLILERLEVNPDWPLINYDNPEMSLIIQHGLPRSEARLPHPRVKGWKPIFGPGRHRLKGAALRWIGSLMQPRPEYPVDYEPPRLETPGATTAADPDDGGDPHQPPGSRAPR